MNFKFMQRVALKWQPSEALLQAKRGLIAHVLPNWTVFALEQLIALNVLEL